MKSLQKKGYNVLCAFFVVVVAMSVFTVGLSVDSASILDLVQSWLRG